MTGLYSPAINHNTRSVEPSHSDDGTGHIFVTAGDGNVSVVPLRSHNGLNAIGDEVPGLQAVAHASGAHGDGVADADGVEAEGHHAGGGDAVPHGLGEAEEVHVAGVALVPDGGDADLGLGHVIVGEADAVEDGLRGALRLGLGDARAVLVELDGGGRWRVRCDGGADGESARVGSESSRRSGDEGVRDGREECGLHCGECWKGFRGRID